MKARLPRRRRHRPFRADDLITDGAESVITGDADITQLAGEDLPGEVDRRLQADARAVLREGELHAVGRRALQRRLPSLQRRPRRSPAISRATSPASNRRPRLPVSRPEGEALAWLPNRFDVTDTTTGFYGGDAKLKYSIAPLGQARPAVERARSTPSGRTSISPTTAISCRWTGVRLAGRWSGRNLLEWPLGRFRERAGDGYSEVIPPAGVEVLAGTRASGLPSGPEQGGVASADRPSADRRRR